MKKISIAYGALLGGLTSLPVIALLYLGNRLAGLPFVPFNLFEWLAQVLPGPLVTLGIDTIVVIVRGLELGPTDTAAKRAEQSLALTLFVLGGMLLGGISAWVACRQPSGQPQQAQRIGIIAGLLLFLIVAAIELALGIPGNPLLALTWLGIIFVGWGALLGYLFPRTTTAEPEGRWQSRRSALAQIAAGSIGLALAAWGVGRLLEREQVESGAGQPLADVLPPATDTPASETSTSETMPVTQTASALDERIEPAPGTRPEITPTQDFYRIDISLQPPTIEGSSWVLETAGLFDNPRPLTLEDLMAMPAVTQPLTLSCISNPIGGDLIGASRWTGVRLRELLVELNLRPETQELLVEAADGFYESVSMADMMDPRTLLVYGMNGETLPVEHGFPLRIYIPNRYGMKQPKWITRIEAIDEQGPGYWVERGWSNEARPHIISIIDSIAQDETTADDTIPIGGIAWAGDRGIQRVEVQVDEGEWTEATLRVPPLSELIWVQWRYDWPLVSGQHTFRVRAVDGDGMVQIGEPSSPHPDGATGYHTVTATI